MKKQIFGIFMVFIMVFSYMPAVASTLAPAPQYTIIEANGYWYRFYVENNYLVYQSAPVSATPTWSSATQASHAAVKSPTHYSVFSYNTTILIGYTTDDSGAYKFHVRHGTASGTITWSNPVDLGTNVNASAISFTKTSSRYFVAFLGYENSAVRVMLYDSTDGATWNRINNPDGFDDGAAKIAITQMPNLTDGVFILTEKYSNNKWYLAYLRWNGTSWVTVGSFTYKITPYITSGGDLRKLALTTYGNYIYVAMPNAYNLLQCSKYDPAADSWLNIVVFGSDDYGTFNISDVSFTATTKALFMFAAHTGSDGHPPGIYYTTLKDAENNQWEPWMALSWGTTLSHLTSVPYINWTVPSGETPTQEFQITPSSGYWGNREYKDITLKTDDGYYVFWVDDNDYSIKYRFVYLNGTMNAVQTLGPTNTSYSDVDRTFLHVAQSGNTALVTARSPDGIVYWYGSIGSNGITWSNRITIGKPDVFNKGTSPDWVKFSTVALDGTQARALATFLYSDGPRFAFCSFTLGGTINSYEYEVTPDVRSGTTVTGYSRFASDKYECIYAWFDAVWNVTFAKTTYNGSWYHQIILADRPDYDTAAFGLDKNFKYMAAGDDNDLLHVYELTPDGAVEIITPISIACCSYVNPLVTEVDGKIYVLAWLCVASSDWRLLRIQITDQVTENKTIIQRTASPSGMCSDWRGIVFHAIYFDNTYGITTTPVVPTPATGGRVGMLWLENGAVQFGQLNYYPAMKIVTVTTNTSTVQPAKWFDISVIVQNDYGADKIANVSLQFYPNIILGWDAGSNAAYIISDPDNTCVLNQTASGKTAITDYVYEFKWCIKLQGDFIPGRLWAPSYYTRVYAIDGNYTTKTVTHICNVNIIYEVNIPPFTITSTKPFITTHYQPDGASWNGATLSFEVKGGGTATVAATPGFFDDKNIYINAWGTIPFLYHAYATQNPPVIDYDNSKINFMNIPSGDVIFTITFVSSGSGSGGDSGGGGGGGGENGDNNNTSDGGQNIGDVINAIIGGLPEPLKIPVAVTLVGLPIILILLLITGGGATVKGARRARR